MPRNREPWSAREERQAVEMQEMGQPYAQIARVLGRTPAAVMNALKRLRSRSDKATSVVHDRPQPDGVRVMTARQQPQGQQAGQAQTQQQLEHALQQHVQAHGLSLPSINWPAVTAAFLQLIQALTQGGASAQAGQGGQPQATP